MWKDGYFLKWNKNKLHPEIVTDKLHSDLNITEKLQPDLPNNNNNLNENIKVTTIIEDTKIEDQINTEKNNSEIISKIIIDK